MKLTKENLDPRHRAFLRLRVDDAPEILDGLAVTGDALLGLVGKGRVPLARVHDHGVASRGGGLEGDVVDPLEVVDELLEDLRAEGGGVLAEVEVLARQRRVVLKEVVPVQIIQGEDALGRVRAVNTPRPEMMLASSGERWKTSCRTGMREATVMFRPSRWMKLWFAREFMAGQGARNSPGWRVFHLEKSSTATAGPTRASAARGQKRMAEVERGYSGQEVTETGAARRSTQSECRGWR